MTILDTVYGVVLGVYQTTMMIWLAEAVTVIREIREADAWHAHAITASPGSIIYPYKGKMMFEELINAYLVNKLPACLTCNLLESCSCHFRYRVCH